MADDTSSKRRKKNEKGKKGMEKESKWLKASRDPNVGIIYFKQNWIGKKRETFWTNDKKNPMKITLKDP